MFFESTKRWGKNGSSKKLICSMVATQDSEERNPTVYLWAETGNYLSDDAEITALPVSDSSFFGLVRDKKEICRGGVSASNEFSISDEKRFFPILQGSGFSAVLQCSVGLGICQTGLPFDDL